MRRNSSLRKLATARSLRWMAFASMGAFLVATAPVAEAQIYTWTGSGTNSSWSTFANWAGSLRPTSTYNSTIRFMGANRKSNTNDLGTLRLGILELSGANWWLSGNALEFQGGGKINTDNTNNLISNNIIINEASGGARNLDVLVGAGNVLTMSGNISGVGKIQTTASGILNLNGTNTNTGGLEMFWGVVNAATSALGGPVAIGQNGTLNWNVSANNTFSNIVSGNGIINKNGSGALTLTGNNSFLGTWGIKGGNLIGNVNAIKSNVHFDSVSPTFLTFMENGNGVHLRNITAAQGGHTVVKDGTGTVAYGGSNIADNIKVHVKNGLFTTNYNGMTNDMQINAEGTLRLGAFTDTRNMFTTLSGAGQFEKTDSGTLLWNTAQNNFEGTVKVDGGRLIGNTSSLTSMFTVAEGGTIEFAQPSNGTFTGEMAGTGRIEKTGAGTLNFKKTNTFNGTFAIMQGNVIVNDFSIRNRVEGAYNTNLIIDVPSFYSQNFYMTGGMGLIVDSVFNGQRVVISNALNDYTGLTDVRSGWLSMTTESASNKIKIASGMIFEFSQNFNGSWSGTVTGDGSFRKYGSGEVAITGSKDSVFAGFSGEMYIWSGALRLVNQAFSGEIWNYADFIYDHSDNRTWTSPIYGGGKFIKDGTGSLAFDGQSLGGSLEVRNGTVLVKENGLSTMGTTTIGTAGRLRLGGGESSYTSGSVINSGEISGSGRIDALVTNSAPGRIIVNSADQMVIQDNLNNSGSIQMLGGTLQVTNKLVNKVGGQISGRGTLRTAASTGTVGLENSGGIAFSGGYSDVFGDVENLAGGQIMTVGGGTTTFHDDMLHNGTEIRTAAGSRTVFLGSLSGAGDFTGTGVVEVQGDMRPGNSPALVTFAGDLELGQTATTTMELAGLDRGTQYDAIDVAGMTRFGGTLDVRTIDDFQVGMGDMFNLFDGNLSGSFHSVYLPTLQNGMYWDVSGLYTDGSIMAVPEPTSMAILTIGLLGLAARRRRRN